MEARLDSNEEFATEFRGFMSDYRKSAESLAVLVERNRTMQLTLDKILQGEETQRNRIGALESQMSVMQLIRAAVFVAIVGIVSMAGAFVWTAAMKTQMIHREEPTQIK